MGLDEQPYSGVHIEWTIRYRELKPMPLPFLLRLIKRIYSGMLAMVANWAHNPEVVGSSPSPASNGSFDYWLGHSTVTAEGRVQFPHEPPLVYCLLFSFDQRFSYEY